MFTPNLLTVEQFSKLHPIFTLGALRALIFRAEENGFNKVIVRFSPTGKRGRVFIDEAKFFIWLAEQQVA